MFFEFQLAERLGMTVRELRKRMTQYEFEEWKTYTRHANRRMEEQVKSASGED